MKTKARKTQVKKMRVTKKTVHRAAFALGFGAMAATLGVGVLALGGPQAVGDRIDGAMNSLIVSAGFSVGGVDVVGASQTDTATIKARADVDVDRNIFGQDLEAMRLRIEDLPWVDRAAVSRQLPNVLKIEVQEHVPFALWQKGRDLNLVNKRGEVIVKAALSAFPELPLVVGDGAPSEAASLMHYLATEPELANRVEAAIRVGERRWDLKFDNDVVLNLPEEGPAQAWRRFAELQKNTGILELGYTRLDLRLPDMLVVRGKDGEPILRREEKGQAT